jgi:hypothetical protein
MIVIANVRTTLESLPPFAVPPLSTARIVTLAVPTVISFGFRSPSERGQRAGNKVGAPHPGLCAFRRLCPRCGEPQR